MTETTAVYARPTPYPAYSTSRLSWQGIIAGVVTALAVQIVLGLVGTAVGLGMVNLANPNAAPSPAAFTIGAAAWTAASMLAALYYGAFIAARVSRHVTRTDGVVQGVVVWATTLLITVTLLSGAAGSAVPAPPHMNNPHMAGPMVNGPGPMAGNAMMAPPAPGAIPGTPPAITPPAMTPPAITPPAPSLTPQQARDTTAEAHEAAKATALAAIVFLLGAIVAAFGGRLGVDHANESLAQETYTRTNIEA